MLKHIKNPENGIPEIPLAKIVIAVKKEATLSDVVLIQRNNEGEFTFFPNNILPIKVFHGSILDCMKKLHGMSYEFYILENFYELKNILNVLKGSEEKMRFSNVYSFKNPMSKIPDIEEDINKQIILTHVDSEYSGFLGMVIKVHDRYMLKGMRIDNIFHNSAVTAWTSTGHSILSAITKFRTNINGNFITIFYVLKSWEEMLCVLNVILE